MNRGLVNLAELRNNFLKADASGKSAYCFIKRDKIIKIYSPKDGENYVPKTVCDFSKYEADTIVFPIEYIYENGIVVGEILKYINSQSIVSSFDDLVDINKIINGFELMIQDIQLYNNIFMKDLCSANILYSNEQGFHIIDTTEWYFTDDATKNNLHMLNSSIIKVILDYLKIDFKFSKYYSYIDQNYYDNLKKFGNDGKRLQDNINLLLNNKYRFLDFMFCYLSLYQKYYGSNMKTLKDMDEMTKVLKKG